ncbi:hypothetical protein [Pseudolactococcus reticulitermitis]|uniref:Uncharacterized protein n=1 Tax=Pseudolactococcus reticulitermitis TaxID=2025039 RepID=A0A224WWW5_9LACT|nr:hypothetical protein [Lactococcus reticulitermitis]GAX46798.1 hypothetical protein RsY01_378 [Lactococcus reticulitermitis]
MQNKNYPRVQIIINADTNEEIQESVKWLSNTVHQSATEWPSESPATKVANAKPSNIKAEGTPPDDVIHEKASEKPKPKAVKKEVSKANDKAEGVTLYDLREKMGKIIKSGNRDGAKALLAAFDVPKLGELPPEKFADFDKGLDELSGGE